MVEISFLEIGAFLVGVAVTTVFNWLVQRMAFSKYMREKGAKSNKKQAEKAERMQLAMLEAAAMFKEGIEPIEIAKQLGAKYPDLAMEFIKKIGKGKLDIAGLLG